MTGAISTESTKHIWFGAHKGEALFRDQAAAPCVPLDLALPYLDTIYVWLLLCSLHMIEVGDLRSDTILL